jgi:hypothetical protein
MRYFLLLLALAISFSCKKEETPPVVVTPDYADSVVGTYLGSEIKYASDHSTQEYNNGSKTMTVVKLDKNKIQVNSFTSGPSAIFVLSDGGTNQGNQIITLTPSGSTQGAGFNSYQLKQITVNIKDGVPKYYYFQGTKQ